MSDENKYVYESPDGGITVTRREFGTLNKEDYYGVPEFPTNYDVHTDVDYVSSWNPILDTNIIGAVDINSVSINSTYSNDITLIDADGKEYSFRQMFDRLEAIEKRLTILVPDDKLLEQYKILQELYDQYKAAESLLFGPTIED